METIRNYRMTMNLTEAEVNELRFALNNLNSPSKSEALEIVESWKAKLAAVVREMNPQASPTVNVK